LGLSVIINETWYNLFFQERYLRFSIMNLAKPRLKLFETTQKTQQYLRLVRYFWQGFEEFDHIPQLFRFNPDLMPASGIEIGEVCGLFDELFAPLFERCTGKVFDRFLRLRRCALAPISFFHPTKEIDQTHPQAVRFYCRIHGIMCGIALGLRIFSKLLAAS
jgi:hypothetical protein